MSLSHELAQLHDLHQRGVLSAEEFERAKQRLLDGSATVRSQAPIVTAANTLRRSLHDRWLGGVCGGLARVSGVAAWVWRLVFVLFAVCAGGGVLLYLLLWLLVPLEAEPVSPAPHPAL